ncbi:MULTISPECIES: hypothetical protein [Bradyrhizobium]|uniref:hypothetical protein n=1 Tax=Bradyrhizobium TaxID=374 RepID=UPI0011244D38|nr:MULTISPECIES: hypothetical protein [Bradyrhizobium]
MAKLLSGLCVLMASLARRMRVPALDLKYQSAFASIAAGYWPHDARRLSNRLAIGISSRCGIRF